MKRFYFFLSMILLGSFSSEDDFVSDLKQKSENYFSKYKRAKLDLFFNQNKYTAGDTVHFRINYVKASDLKPIVERQIVHLLWFNSSGKKAMTQWATINNGMANCKMVIPKDFAAGNYVVVAFTDWMKNFDQSLFFKQKFVVTEKYVIHDIQPTDSVLFYPESGSLVANVENNLAIVYQGQEKTNKIVIRENDHEIGLLSAQCDSVMVFKFTPKSNATYSAEIFTAGGTKKFQMPSAKNTGATLSVAATDLIKITATTSEVQPKEKYYLSVFSGKGLVYQTDVDFKNTITLPSNLPNGIAQVVLSDSKFNLLASRVIYIGNPSIKKIKAENLQSTYTTRQAVKFQLLGEDGKNMKGNFSCRIINGDLFPQSNFNGINYLNFQSDISNTFDFKNKLVNSSSVNDYLITQTCPWFDWKKITADDKTTMAYTPQEYLKISGNASFAKTKKPVKDSTLIMLFLEKSLKGYETYTSSKGNFSFMLFPAVTQSDRFFYAASFKDNDVDDIYIKLHDSDSTIQFFATSFSIDKTVVDSYAVYGAQRNTINHSYSFFTNSQVRNDSVDDPNKYIEDKLPVDMSMNLADYLQMPTMPEVIKEILKAVEYRQINGRNIIRMYTTSSKKPTNHTAPLFVIDGMLTKDADHLISLRPSDVVSIKLVRDVRKLITFGKIAANGVILVKTKKENAAVYETRMIDFPGLLPSSNFNLSKSNLQMPDLRSCLYWNTQTNSADDEINFTTSDDVGNFKLQVYGLTEDGNSVYSEFPFTVNYKN